ncbi:MAG: hypothetical protein KGJ72_13935 [Gammaproteobacteria bacterium]|nr:hypothetical protein [Gammaproteobacteria bacterium]
MAGRAEATAEELAASPEWFPLEMAGQRAIRLVRLDEAAYEAASFLDRRVLRSQPAERRCSVESAAIAGARLAPDAHYIFHIGHVGSTLVSRLVGGHEALFSVREPALLRAAAAAPEAAIAGLSLRDQLALLARTWRPGQRAVIKPTSYVGEQAGTILGLHERSAAIFMFTPPLNYLRAILAGPNSRSESRVLAPLRLLRLRERTGAGAVARDPESEGEWIAMNWLCEMTALRQAADRFASRVLWVDFDEFLAAPASGLNAVFRTLGVPLESREIERLLRGEVMSRYSKAPEYAYDADLRRQVLASADHEHGHEIRRGVDWLTRLAGRHPLIDASLSRRAPEGGGQN